jgi:hypothetical protein
MIPAFVWEYKLILRFIIRVSSHLKEALCVFGGSTIQEFTVLIFSWGICPKCPAVATPLNLRA